MKILVVISKFLPEYSGPSIRIKNLYERLAKKKFLKNKNILFLAGGEEFNENKTYYIKNFKVKRFKNTNSTNQISDYYNYYRNFFCIQREINFFKPDLIHVIGSNMLTASAIIISRIKNIPLCVELVNSTSKPNQNLPILKYFWRPNLNYNAKIIVISKFLKRKCLSMGYKNIWYRPNPININSLKKIKKIKTNKKILLNIGQFIPRKNQKFLVEVMKYLPHNFKLFLCGPLVTMGSKKQRDLKYFNEIKKIIKDQKLTKRITLIPRYVDPKKYFKKTDLYLMPSYDEGLGNTIIESLASGVSVMANSSEPSFKEIIKDNQNGFLVKMKQEEWARSIIKNINKLNTKKVRINSKKIFSLANEISIDKKYYKIFKEMTTL